jgi:flavin reductase (DIM6/NTAB) family NADH-FMN oxidoreductase RutF
VSNGAFESFAASSDSPMVLVTAGHDGNADGCLVGFSTQCSMQPRRFLACLSKVNKTYLVAATARTLVVHILHDNPDDRALARLFGEETAFVTDKLAQCAWEAGPDGTPVLDGPSYFAGRILDRVDLGDHVGFVLDIRSGRSTRSGEPLLSYQRVKDLDPGNPV